jgi:hypothetical protein
MRLASMDDRLQLSFHLTTQTLVEYSWLAGKKMKDGASEGGLIISRKAAPPPEHPEIRSGWAKTR